MFIFLTVWKQNITHNTFQYFTWVVDRRRPYHHFHVPSCKYQLDDTGGMSGVLCSISSTHHCCLEGVNISGGFVSVALHHISWRSLFFQIVALSWHLCKMQCNDLSHFVKITDSWSVLIISSTIWVPIVITSNEILKIESDTFCTWAMAHSYVMKCTFQKDIDVSFFL